MAAVLSNLQNFNVSNLSETLSVESLQNNFQAVKAKVSSLRPPQEFFDVRHFSKPSNLSELQQRVSYNLSYYQSNYIAIILILSIYALITNSLLLFVVVLIIGGMFLIGKLGGEDLVTPVGVFTSSQLYTTLMIITVPLCFLASPISTVMWLIGSSCVCVFSHASLMEKPIETVFEETV